jgi:hypothetical protein
MEPKIFIFCLIFNYIIGVNINIKNKSILRKTRTYIKKLQNTVIICFLVLQFVFLNSFTLFLSCGRTCCHNPAPVKNECSCCCEMEKEISCPLEKNNDTTVANRCHCFHAEKTEENYVIEQKFSNTFPSADFFTLPSSNTLKSFSGIFEKQYKEVKLNSPPIYISNSSLII